MMDRPAVQSRYEYKYLVPETWVPEIRRHLHPFVRPDRFAAGSGGVYPISSLYLDSADLRLLRMSQEGWCERMKLRARTYSGRAEDPVYLEVKRRFNGIVHKARARVPRDAARGFLRSHSWNGPGFAGTVELRQFLDLARDFAARPVRHVRYEREAYESRGGEPVRATFDRALEHADGCDGDLAPGRARWHALAQEGVVLELKFTDAFPAWMSALVGRFDLERRSISKYALAMQAGTRARCSPAGAPAPTPAGRLGRRELHR